MPSSSSSPGTQPTVDGFLRAVLRSGLMDRAQLKSSLKGVPRDQRGDPTALADHLVRGGKLSRFQASKLLRGTASGLLLGHFQILTPIGQGGMGTVFLAQDERSKQLVALKVLPPRRARTEERMLARFQREMQLSQKVTHPHLAWTYEVGEIRGVYYIAMEFIPGKTLSRIVAESGPLPLARACRLMAEVACGLEHAHNEGLIHRDLKPSNIQITPRDHAKILDLGLALIPGETDVDPTIVGGRGYVVGTMDYIAPEQITDALQVDGRADLYSLGCTLYFVLTGRAPFPGGTSKDKIRRQRSDEPTPIEELRADLPPAFVVFLRSMMSKDPAGRPPSAGVVATELKGWAEEEPVQVVENLSDLDVKEAVGNLQAVGSSEYSAVNLPDLEAIPVEDPDAVELSEPILGLVSESPEQNAPPWVLIGLAVALVGLGVTVFLVVLGLILIHLW